MINFNEPPYMEKSIDYIRKAVENKKICGDGEYTKKCNAWLEEHTGTKKALLILYPCNRACGNSVRNQAGRRSNYAGLYLCINSRCFCVERGKGGICRYPAGYHEYR